MSKDDVNAVLTEGIHAALHFLGKSGEFYPFGVVKTTDGELRHVHGCTESDYPDSERVIQVLRSGLRERAISGEYRTTALVYDALLREKDSVVVTDAICCEIEDIDEQPVVCYLPYWGSGGSIKTGEMVAAEATGATFRRVTR